MIGRTLSHYKVLEEISRDGMGSVYKVLDLKLDREVALKVLPPELVSDPPFQKRSIRTRDAISAFLCHERKRTRSEPPTLNAKILPTFNSDIATDHIATKMP